MKMTKSMVYVPSHEATELAIFAINEQKLYGRLQSVVKSLARKWRKGTYDPEKAVICYYRAATEAAKIYDLLYGNPFHKTFTVTDRWTAAVDLEEHFREDVEAEVEAA